MVTTHEPQQQDIETAEEPSITIGTLVRVVRLYRHIILLSLIGLAMAYFLGAAVVYLLSPTERTTSQSLRLDFEGASNGRYPNGTAFTPSDIVSGPILNRVYQDNRLSDYVNFGEFSRSIFVLESNREYEELAAAYLARLSDPKLTPIDRERLQKEFDQKSQSISKNEYAISYVRRVGFRGVPELLARKVLLDALNEWADSAVNQRHVILYQVSALGADIFNPTSVESQNLVAAIEVLRSKLLRVTRNITVLQRLPGALLARTPRERVSLDELKLHIDEIIRFRLDPLLLSVHQSGLDNTVTTLQFLQSQLAYDQRELAAAEQGATSIRETLSMYEEHAASGTQSTSVSRPQDTMKPATQSGSSEAVMPQIGDTFIDRLLNLTGRAEDVKYRQKLADDYRHAFELTIPLQQAVAYDQSVLAQLSGPRGSAKLTDPPAVRAEIESARADGRKLVGQMNELYLIISRNLTPSTQLFTLTSTPTTRDLRSLNLSRTLVLGLVLLLLATPIVIGLCVVHYQVVRETSDEARSDAAAA